MTLSGQFTQSAKEEVLSSLQQALYQASVNLNERMEAIESVSALIAYDSRLQTAIGRRDGPGALAGMIKDITELREMLEPVLIRQDIAGVRIYLPQEQLLSREGVYFYSMEDARALPEYDMILASGGAGVWIGERMVSSPQFKGRVISFARFVRNPNNFDEAAAILLLDIPLSRLRGVLGSLSMAQRESRLFLLDNQGGLALAAGEAPVEEEFVKAVAARDGAAQATAVWDIRQVPYVFMHVPLLRGGWELVAALPDTALLEKHALISHVLPTIVLAVVVLCAACIAMLLVVVYTRSIKKQIRQMNGELAASGMVGLIAQPVRQDIFHLRAGVSQLLDTATALIDDAYQAQVREREAAFRVLQAQINPHFLYNTLDTIYWMALRQNAADAAGMIKALSDYFRLSLSSGRDIVALEEEVCMVRAYLAIQAERYDHEFDVSWDIAPEALGCLMPKLTLQPLAENALLHGVRQRAQAEGGLLNIRAGLKDDMLELRVEDNGPGFSPAARAQLDDSGGGQKAEGNGGQKKEEGGYGLRNVRERLRLFSGGRFELRFKDGGGLTTVLVRLAVRLRESI